MPRNPKTPNPAIDRYRKPYAPVLRAKHAATQQEKIQWLIARRELWESAYCSDDHERKKTVFAQMGLLMKQEGLVSPKTRASDIGSARFIQQAADRLGIQGQLR